MEKLWRNPYPIFLVSIPLVLVIGLLSGDTTWDVNIHDTYYVIAYTIITWLIAIILGIFGLGYWLMHRLNRDLSKGLNILHLGLIYGGALILWILSQSFRSDFMEYKFNDNLSLAVMLVLILIILGQLVFPINLIYALTRKRKRDKL